MCKQLNMGKLDNKKFNKKWSYKGNLIPDWNVNGQMNKIELINIHINYTYNINPYIFKYNFLKIKFKIKNFADIKFINIK